jgi:hypothetical protein
MWLRSSVGLVLSASLALADSFNGLGPGIVACGDVNKDGVIDLIVASRDNRSPEVVWLLSGKDGSVLHVFLGPDDALGFGCIIGSPGDLDGDGSPDIAISTSGGRTIVQGWSNNEHSPPTPAFERLARGSRRCEFISSRDYSLLLELSSSGCASVIKGRIPKGPAEFAFLVPENGPDRSSYTAIRSSKDQRVTLEIPAPSDVHFLNSACCIDDVNGDGIEDIAIASYITQKDPKCGTTGTGMLVVSGKDGREIWRDGRDTGGAGSSVRLQAIGDLNHDGVGDILVGSESRWVRALSGKDGELLYEVSGLYSPWALDNFATSLDTVGDVDGDGLPDWVVGANEEIGVPFFDEGYVWLCSGKDGHKIRELVRSSVNGYDVCSLGDADRDKNPDVALLIENAQQRWTAEFNPIVRVISTKDGHTLWEKDTKALRAVRDDLKATAESAPPKPDEPTKPR